jgi:hypothetical protein
MVFAVLAGQFGTNRREPMIIEIDAEDIKAVKRLLEYIGR